MIEAPKVVEDENSAVDTVVTYLSLFEVNHTEVFNNLPKLQEFENPQKS